MDNVGPVDAAARLALCTLLAIAAMDALVFFDGATAWTVSGTLAALAVLAGVTGVVRTCPLYRVLRIDTRRRPATA